MKHSIPITFALAVIPLLFSSCYSLKDSIYLQGDISKELNEVDGAFIQKSSDYIVKNNDVLYIRVSSLDERTSSFLNNQSGYTTMPESPMSASLLGYRVSMDGSIEYPFIGKIYVAGLTMEEIQAKLQLAVGKYIEQSSVIVKLLNDNITVMGEVNAPGRFMLSSEKINIMEAISLAGEITDFGNRKRIRLIRKEGEIPQMFVIDATDERLIYSPYFILQPGDILYVEPRKFKAVSMSAVPLSLGVSLISVVILTLTYINTLETAN